MRAAFAAVGLLAVSAWAFAAVQFVLLVSHRREGVSVWSLLSRGMRAFDPQWFASEGLPYQRRLILGFYAFFACLALMAALAFIGMARSR